MNGRRPRAVLLGRVGTMPFGGVLWQTLHYLVGLERLGFEAWYVEAHGVAPRHFIRDPEDDGSEATAEFLDSYLRPYGFGARWAFHALHSDGRCYGLGRRRLRRLYESSDVLLNLHGGTVPLPEHRGAGPLVCIATDPVQMEVELNQRVSSTHSFFAAHDAVFSFGENLGAADCGLPVLPDCPILPTRQPVVLDLWRAEDVATRDRFTTVANWVQQRSLRFAGETYEWSKDLEFRKLIDLPSRTAQPLELALSRCPEEDRRELRRHGWHLRDALSLSTRAEPYREYLRGSRGEFTVAKDQNVRLRSGWFSDRSATYLAASRPVVTQDTGFGAILPTGEGLFSFREVDEAAAAIDTINADYRRHRRAAREIARTYFDSGVVLRQLLERAGVDLPGRRAHRVVMVAHRFPPDAMGGVERYTEKVAEALVARGHRVDVVCRTPAEGPLRREVEALANGVFVHRLTGGRIDRNHFLRGSHEGERLFREVLAETDPDVVHVNHLLDLPPKLPAIAAAEGCGVVLTLHDYYAACRRIVLRRPSGEGCAGPEGGLRCAGECRGGGSDTAHSVLRTRFFERLLGVAHRVVTPSDHVSAFFAALGVERRCLRTIANGVWTPALARRAVVSRDPLERGHLSLAFLGAVVPHKGLAEVLDAVERAGLDRVELTAFGSVGDTTLAAELYHRAERIAGLEFRMYGEYEPDEMPVMLSDVDCVVVPSQWPETFCLVAYEALAHGVPVLVSRMGALPDAVVDGVNGFTFDAEDTEQLAGLLARMASEPGLVSRLRAGARASTFATLEEHVDRLLQTYVEALGERDDRGSRAHDDHELRAIEAALDALDATGDTSEPPADAGPSHPLLRVVPALPGASR